MMLPIARKPASVNRRVSPLLVPDECQGPCRPVVALPPRGAVAARDKLNHLQRSLSTPTKPLRRECLPKGAYISTPVASGPALCTQPRKTGPFGA